MSMHKAILLVTLAFALFFALSKSTLLDTPILTSVIYRLTGTRIAFEEGIEIIKNKGYPINHNLKWHEIKAAGIKMNEKTLKSFLQICERLVLDFGNIQIYADVEARVMWVWADPTASASEREIYYVKFL